MVCLRIILIVSLCWISGCASSKGMKAPSRPMTMHDLHHQSREDVRPQIKAFMEERFKQEKRFGYVTPYLPIINQAVVRKVWVPDHKSKDDPDVMIAGHWVYLMIKPAAWFIDERTAEEDIPVIVPSSPL